MVILIGHFMGRFPFWISEQQVGIVPVNDEHIKYTNHIAKN